MINEFKNKTILITGGAGSIGSVIATELLKYEPKAIRIYDNHEYSLYKLERKLNDKDNKVMRYILGDVRDADRLTKIMEDVNIVYHTAAYKHVPLCEYNPSEAVKTNVLGTQNVVDAALRNKVEKVVLISTDKAANPTGTLGASKLLAEKIIIAGNYRNPKTIFSSVRFGNVTMSSGSVIPNFIYQIQHGGPVTVTSSKMTRFFMSVHEAANLIFTATKMMLGGEVFVFKMKSLKIDDLAHTIIKTYPYKNPEDKKKISIKYIGTRPGEKMHEQLIFDDECEKVVETKELLVLLPSVGTSYGTLQSAHPWESKVKKIKTSDYFSNKRLMSRSELERFVRENNFMDHIAEI
jgi:UDP-N-acetylglucosamine 4,6-dehydratase/5-epimerase